MIPRVILLLSLTYKLAVPGYQLEFPRDHGAHPEYRLEWWYFTGNLWTPEGRRFGYEVTFFRTGLDRRADNPSRWTADHLYVSHFALTDAQDEQFHHFEKVNRAGPGVAGAEEGRLEVWNEDWSARMDGERIHLRASGDRIRLELTLLPLKPPVLHGRDGFSRKAEGEGRASYYYSFTRLETRGELSYRDRVHPVRGESWMDQEFGTHQLEEEQIGWDWFSIQLENGEEMMVFEIRRSDGSLDPHSSGTVVGREGKGSHLERDDFRLRALRRWTSPHSGGVYPLDWILEVPSLEARLRIRPVLDDQELLTVRSTGVVYWEGAVDVEGSWRGEPVRGHGYVELTGYVEEFRPRF